MNKNKIKTMSECARRENELAQYGKLLSLRPSIVHSTKKTYSRKDKSWKRSMDF